MRSYFVSLLLAATLMLSACAEVELASHVAKSVGGPQGASSGSAGNFKVGKPYRIDGQWYNPTETYDMTQTGIASWYGPGFHGKRTANGERFNENELTAAHKTLQMPSLVRVTNLENGKSIVVRVNDRGPFSRGRIIDLSKKGAELLGFKNQGTAKVRVQVLTEESKRIAEAAKQGQSTKGYEVAMNRHGELPDHAPILTQASNQVSAGNIPGHITDGEFYPDPIVRQLPATGGNVFVQVASFSDQNNASAMSQKLSNIGEAHISAINLQGRPFYRVRLGPMDTIEQADQVLSRLSQAGYGDAMTIVE